MQTIRCKLVALKEGTYTIYVFDNLDKDIIDEYKYIMCTRVPNWETCDEPKLEEIGYLQFNFVKAGDNYFHTGLLEQQVYKYTAYYFINYIKEPEKINLTEFKF